MCLNAYFQRRLELMAPQETITFTRESLEWLLAEHGAGCGHVAADGESTVGRLVPASAIFSVADLAEEFRTAESSMRALVADGLFGPATALRHGIAGSTRKMPFRVPAQLVAAVREMVGQGQKLHTFCVLPSRSTELPDESSHDRVASEVAVTAGDRQVESRSEGTPTVTTPRPATTRPKRAPQSLMRPTAPARRRRSDGDTDLGGWRKHVKQGG